GYYGRPDLTEKVFFETESRGQKKRGYRTGDAAYEQNGLYYFCGRMDFQIKLNGYRIELEDIENNLVKIENVSRAVVIPVMKEEKVDYLAAFILSTKAVEGPKLREITRIKSELTKLVPAYMVPRKIVLCDSLPTNTNGKVDRKVLAAQL
ncbi:MAG: AMP-binding protein, partial [Oscillospiraceae bacterium]|nr:AMP-binding protein [Oscillospiraceae bacterium]